MQACRFVGCTIVSLLLPFIWAQSKLIHLLTHKFHHSFLFISCVIAVLKFSALG